MYTDMKEKDKKQVCKKLINNCLKNKYDNIRFVFKL